MYATITDHRTRRTFAAVTAVLLLASLLILPTSPAEAALNAAGPIGDDGFPKWYEDGLRLGICDMEGDENTHVATNQGRISDRQEWGCHLEAPGDDCDFAELLATDIGPFLVSLADGIPIGYIGDPDVAAPVAGSPHTDPMTQMPANLLRISGPGLPDGAVELHDFAITGRIADDAPPSVPRELTAARAGDGAAALTWRQPTSADYMDADHVDDYEITATATGHPAVTEVVPHVPGDGAQEHVVSGLVNGGLYTFQLVARNEHGDSPATMTELLVGTVPGQPDPPMVDTTTVGAFEVSWMTPDDGGLGIDSYTLAWTSPTAAGDSLTVDGATTSASLGRADGLVPGASYTFPP